MKKQTKLFESICIGYEAYQHKCKRCRKPDDQTHLEFARKKELLFDKY